MRPPHFSPCQPTVASKPPTGPGWAHELMPPTGRGVIRWLPRTRQGSGARQLLILKLFGLAQMASLTSADAER
jgi:hypothetical protein